MRPRKLRPLPPILCVHREGGWSVLSEDQIARHGVAIVHARMLGGWRRARSRTPHRGGGRGAKLNFMARWIESALAALKASPEEGRKRKGDPVPEIESTD